MWTTARYALPAIPVGLAEPELTSTDPAGPGRPSAGDPRVQPSPARAALRRLLSCSHREPGHVTAQRQLAQASPQPTPKRGLGLGAPLNGPPGRPPAPARPVPAAPLVARSAGPSAPPDSRLALPEPGHQSTGQAKYVPPAAVSVQPALTDPARPPGLGPPALPPAKPAPAKPAPAGAAPPSRAHRACASRSRAYRSCAGRSRDDRACAGRSRAVGGRASLDHAVR